MGGYRAKKKNRNDLEVITIPVFKKLVVSVLQEFNVFISRPLAMVKID